MSVVSLFLLLSCGRDSENRISLTPSDNRALTQAQANGLWLMRGLKDVAGKVNQTEHYYSSFYRAVQYEDQLGMFPNLSYRIEF